MEERQNIGNVNVLDLRKATEAALARIGRIGNVNLLLYSQETAGLVTRLRLGNVNTSVMVPAGVEAKPIMGSVMIDRDYLHGLTAPLYLVVMGQVIVDADVPAEDIEKGLSGLVVLGHIFYPENLREAVLSKLVRLNGQSKVYPHLDHFHSGALVLDEEYLQRLPDGAGLVVLGNLHLPKVLPNDLLERKLGKLFVGGKVVMHEENMAVVQSRLLDGSGKGRVIPTGFELVDRPLTLDAGLLPFLPGKKLYCTERVVVAADVTAALLDKQLEALVAKDLVVCPASLRAVMAKKMNLLETRTIFYEGTLWLVDDAMKLDASRFEYLDGPATLVVLGEVEIDPALDPKVLADRLAKVHNMGAIRCTPAQAGAIQLRLGMSEGEIVDGAGEEKKEERGGIGNMNYLEL